MRINAVKILYKNGHSLTSIDLDELIDMANEYNRQNGIKHKMSIHKLRRYTGGNVSIPKAYASISKTRLNEVIGEQNLSTMDYKTAFQKINSFENRVLRAYEEHSLMGDGNIQLRLNERIKL
jgi:hypothetical protein